jgi:hypothetical protein
MAMLLSCIQSKFIQIIKINLYKMHVFQASIIRVNIMYSVFKHNLDKNRTNTVCQLIQRKLAQYLAPAKIIVYNRTIKQTTKLSQALDCHKYYRKVGNCEKKEKIIKR